MKQIRVLLAICIGFVVMVTSVLPTIATPATNTEQELSDLKNEAQNLESELDYTLSEIARIDSELTQIRQELAVAKGLEAAQYDAMKVRIKYMYKNSNNSFLEMLFTSSCLAEFIKRAEYYTAIVKYDRQLLKDLEENSKFIAEKEAELLQSQEQLEVLQRDLTIKGSMLNDQIAAKLAQAQEEARQAEEKAKEEIQPIIPEKEEPAPDYDSDYEGASDHVSDNEPVSATASDVELLAALIECEAGSTHYEGMLAVGSVVVNRMKSSYYPDTLRGVIFQSGQFPPALNGKVDRILKRGVKNSCMTAAQDALNGKNNVGNCLSFRAASSGRPGTVIGDNVFF